MTSTANGPGGLSFGWINRELIGSGKFEPHMNVFGREDRFWIGPEGGQYSVFFGEGSPFDLEHWQTPAPIDTEPFALAHRSAESAEFRHQFRLTNYSGATFDLQVVREVRLLSRARIGELIDMETPDGVRVVGFESVNRLTNAGEAPWKKETGLLSIWVLGMFNPSPGTVIVVPIKSGSEAERGPRVNSDYFGVVPPERLVAREDVVFFSGDGKYRSKIGMGPGRAKPILGSFDDARNVLTIVQYSLPRGATDYVNSAWRLQENPYGGDVVNSYNDGPPEPGAEPLGPFYELESSSPAGALAPGQTLEHIHRTFHFRGTEEALDGLARELLGVGVDEIKKALP